MIKKIINKVFHVKEESNKMIYSRGWVDSLNILSHRISESNPSVDEILTMIEDVKNMM